jgi:DNA-binding PadR family transcriptional regulator
MWGYMIKKQAETKFHVKLRHGALYPLLKTMEKESFVTAETKRHGGRIRKIYTITKKGEQYLESYSIILKEQIQNRDIQEEDNDESTPKNQESNSRPSRTPDPRSSRKERKTNPRTSETIDARRPR